MADAAPELPGPEFPGYTLDPAADERAKKAQAAFRQSFADLAPDTMFDTEPQGIETALNRLAGGASKGA